MIYYLILINNYGTINPSLGVIAPEYYKTTPFYNTRIYKPAYPFHVYAKKYWKNFCNYWTGISYDSKYSNRTILEVIPSVLVFAIPIIYCIWKIKTFIYSKKNKEQYEKIEITNVSIGIAVIIAVVIQFAKAYYEFKYVSGYLGAFQSRYYVCAMVSFAILLCYMIDKLMNNKQKKKYKKVICGILAIAYIVILQLGVII